MTKFNKKNGLFSRYNFMFDLIKESKLKLIIFSTFIFIAFLTGIIVAVKTKACYYDLGKLGIVCVTKGGIINTSFFTRFLSMLFVALVCFGCSFCKYLFPLSVLLLSYRGYLLGVNICLIISVNGMAGVIVALLIALPCQLLALGTLLLFYVLMSKTNKDCSKWGGCKVPSQKLKIVLMSLSAILAICLIESLLIALFSPGVILVI